jgi:hypothetical protein
MVFIESELFNNKRRNWTVYERLWSILLVHNPDGIF